METIIYENNGVKQEITKDELIIMLRDRISKAIEYIEKNVWSCYILDDEKELIETDSEELLEILKGSDKE